MKREIKVEKRKGRGKVYTNLCPVRRTTHEDIMVGSPKCRECEHCVRVMGNRYIHCNAIAEGE